MQEGQRSLNWAYVFFGCGAVMLVLALWRTFRSAAGPVSRLGPEVVFAAIMLGLYVAGTLLTVRRLPTLSVLQARQSVLLQAGLGFLMAAALLNLR